MTIVIFVVTAAQRGLSSIQVHCRKADGHVAAAQGNVCAAQEYRERLDTLAGDVRRHVSLASGVSADLLLQA